MPQSDSKHSHVQTYWEAEASDYFSALYSDDFWTYYDNPQDDSLKGRYKLHISIHPALFRQYETRLHLLLHEALQDGIINQYKACNIDHKGCGVNQRQLHAPIAIYLKDKNSKDPEYLLKIGLLCEKIESVLNGVKPGNKDTLTECDLFVSPHIVFRQAYFNSDTKNNQNEGLWNYRDPEKYAKLLRAEGLESPAYKALSSQLLPLLPLHYITKINRLIEVLLFDRSLLYVEQQRICDQYKDQDPKYLAITEIIGNLDLLITTMNETIIDIKKSNSRDKLVLKQQTKSFTTATELAIKLSANEEKILYTKRPSSYLFNSTRANVQDIQKQVAYQFAHRKGF